MSNLKEKKNVKCCNSKTISNITKTSQLKKIIFSTIHIKCAVE